MDPESEVGLIATLKSTVAHIAAHPTRVKFQDFALLLGPLDHDETFYHVYSFLKEFDPSLIDKINNLSNVSDEDEYLRKLGKKLKKAYLKAVEESKTDLKQIRAMRHALHKFARKYDIELISLIGDAEGKIQQETQKKRFEKYITKYQKGKSARSWEKLEKFFQDLMEKVNKEKANQEKVNQEKLSEVVTAENNDAVATQNNNNTSTNTNAKSPKELLNIKLLKIQEQLNQDNVNSYNLHAEKLKLEMEIRLQEIQEYVRNYIPFEEMDSIRKHLIFAYHKHKLTQNLFIIDEAIREAEIAKNLKENHYTNGFKQAKKTIESVIGYRLVYFDATDSHHETDLDTLSRLSKKFGGNPILYKKKNNGTEELWMYGYSEKNKWENTKLELEPKWLDKKIKIKIVDVSSGKKSTNKISISQYLANLKNKESDQFITNKIKRKLYKKLKKAHTLDGQASKTALRYHLPSIFWDNTLDKDLFHIIHFLELLDLHKELEGLKTVLCQLENQESDRDKLEYLMNNLYAMYNSLSILEGVKDGERVKLVSDEELAKLKSYIHAYARKYQFPEKIFNIEKLLRENKGTEVDEIISRQLHGTPNRKYAYIPNLPKELTQRKINLRKKKSTMDWISKVATTLVGIGEGAIATVFLLKLAAAATFLSPLFVLLGPALIPLAIIVGIAGFSVNYYLFRKDSYHTLKEFFVYKSLFKDANGNRISVPKMIAIGFALVTVSAASAVFGVLTFVAVSFLVGSMVAFPPAAMFVGVAIALAMLVCNTGVFYFVMQDFIKNDGIKKVAAFFKENFYDVFKFKDTPQLKWANLSWGRKALHVIGAILKIGFKAAFLIGTLGVCAFLTSITFGLGYLNAVKILSKYTALSSAAISAISYVTIYGVASVGNFFFYAGGVMKVLLGGVKAGIENACSWVWNNFGEIGKSISKSWKAFNKNPVRRVAIAVTAAKIVGLGTGAIINGYVGQGLGAVGSSKSISNVIKLAAFATVELTLRAAQYVAWLTLGTGSFSVNFMASAKANKIADSINTKQIHKKLSNNSDNNNANTNTKNKSEPGTQVVVDNVALPSVKKKKKVANDMEAACLYFNELRKARKRPIEIVEAKPEASVEHIEITNQPNGLKEITIGEPTNASDKSDKRRSEPFDLKTFDSILEKALSQGKKEVKNDQSFVELPPQKIAR